MFKRVLVGTDLEAKSSVALRMGNALARANGAELVALHVVPLPPELRRWGHDVFKQELRSYRKILDAQASAARTELEKTVARMTRRSSRPVLCLVRVGEPAAVIAATADEIGADLIVTARGRDGVLGANTERLVRMAGRTILVAPVRAPAAFSAAERLGFSGLLAPAARKRRT
jgi:nucleotide-binding universal stress UspA family protein